MLVKFSVGSTLILVGQLNKKREKERTPSNKIILAEGVKNDIQLKEIEKGTDTS